MGRKESNQTNKATISFEQIKKLARKLRFCPYDNLQWANDNDADQTAQMRRLVCAFVVLFYFYFNTAQVISASRASHTPNLAVEAHCFSTGHCSCKYS